MYVQSSVIEILMGYVIKPEKWQFRSYFSACHTLLFTYHYEMEREFDPFAFWSQDVPGTIAFLWILLRKIWCRKQALFTLHVCAAFRFG